MKRVLVAGAGKIGSLIARLLGSEADYSVFLVDVNEAALHRATQNFPKEIHCEVFDIQADNASAWIREHRIEAIVSCLPYHQNFYVAQLAFEMGLHYFDLTEDTQVKDRVEELAKKANTVFVPHCGLAPGFINIVAHTLIQDFDKVNVVKLRSGALPAFTSNALGYAITWSIDGLINQYGNLCHALDNGKIRAFRPLSDLEMLELDGVRYEAFHTSGGVGSLIHTYEGKINKLDYKTLRYPGHAEKMHFLLHDLQLNEDRATLKMILQRSIPTTYVDKVVVYVSVMGEIHNQLVEKTFHQIFCPMKLFEQSWLAIQISTACSAAAVIDSVLSNISHYTGFVRQEDFNLKSILSNRFGMYLKS